MKCPYCNTEMEQGFIQSGSPIFWSTQKRFAKIPSHPQDVGIADGELTGFFAESFYCRACNKLITEPHNP